MLSGRDFLSLVGVVDDDISEVVFWERIEQALVGLGAFANFFNDHLAIINHNPKKEKPVGTRPTGEDTYRFLLEIFEDDVSALLLHFEVLVDLGAVFMEGKSGVHSKSCVGDPS